MTTPAARSRGERISAAATVKIGAAIAAATKEAGPVAVRTNSLEELRATM
jgi:putative N-acetylmannosamine-6-phosphate epimerase